MQPGPRTKSLCWRSVLSQLTVMSIIATVIALLAPVGGTAVCQEPSDGVDWLTGKDLDQENQLAFSASWTDAPLRSRLTAFANQRKIGIFIDRRVDPGLQINISMSQVTSEQFLWEIADRCGIGVCRIEDFYYLGPLETAATLPHVWKTLKGETSKLRRASPVQWTDSQPMKFNSIVSPRNLIQDLAQEYDFHPTNLDEISHDVWFGFELPAMSLDSRIAILTVGFDKWYRRSSNGKTITIVDFPTVPTAQTEFRNLTNAKQISRDLKERFPDLKISSTRTSIKATGPPLSLAQLNRAVVQLRAPIVSEKTPPLTLTTKASRKAILMRIAQLTLRDFQSTEASSAALGEQVAINVKEVSVERLIQEVLKDSDLKFDLDDRQLRISRK